MSHTLGSASRVPVLVLAVLLAGCGGAAATQDASISPATAGPASSSPGTSPAGAPATISTVSAPPTASGLRSEEPLPSAEASPSVGGVQPLHYGSLAGGTYRPVGFPIPMTFTVQDGVHDGFANVVDDKWYVEMRSQQLAIDQVIFDLPLNFMREGSKSAFAVLRDRHIPVGKETPVTIGGLQGAQVEFTAPSELAKGFGLGLFEDGEGTYFASPQEHDRLIVVRVGDRNLVILVAAPSEAEFAVFAPRAQQLLDSLHFE